MTAVSEWLQRVERHRSLVIGVVVAALLGLILLVSQIGGDDVDESIADVSAGASDGATEPGDDGLFTEGDGSSGVEVAQGTDEVTDPADAGEDDVSDDGVDGSDEDATVAPTPNEPAGDTADDPGDEPTAPESTIPTIEPEAEGVEIPIPPDIETTESETCLGVKDGLQRYRDLAVTSPIEEFLQLQLGLEEFENVTDFVGEGQDWSNRIVGLLVDVRRDWSTAFAADGEGDQATVDERLGAALEALDEALEIPCPEE